MFDENFEEERQCAIAAETVSMGTREKIAHRFSQTILFRLLCSNQIRVIRVIRGLFFFLVSNDKSGLKLKSVIFIPIKVVSLMLIGVKTPYFLFLEGV